MWLRYNGPLWHQNDLCSLRVDVERPQDQDEAVEGGKALDRLQPIVVEVEEQHLGLSCLEDAVTELLDFENGLVRELELTSLNDDVWEVKEMDLERVQHAFSRHDDLLGLLFY